MTVEQRALDILDLFERAGLRAGRRMQGALTGVRSLLATPGPEAAPVAAKILSKGRQRRDRAVNGAMKC